MRRPFGIPVPAAPAGTHLLAAAILWSVVGLGLFLVGSSWILAAHSVWGLPTLALALLLGWLKARWFLFRTAGRIVARIESRGNGKCLGGFLSPRSWILVLCMMLLGRLLRRSSLPLLGRGLIYSAIGTALFLASLIIWRRRAQRS